ncbi:hypothetical protein N9B98_00090 [bacterium]|nr:hypothetical protein [bacterium]
MKVASKHLSVAVAIVLLSLQSAFAGIGKTTSPDNEELKSSSATTTPSTQKPSVSDLPRDDGLIAVVIITALLATSDQHERLAGADDAGESIHAREWLMLMDTGFTGNEAVMALVLTSEGLTLNEACELVLTDLVLNTQNDETELKRPTFGPHITTCDSFFNSERPVE